MKWQGGGVAGARGDIGGGVLPCGVSLAVVLSLVASYVVALTVVPLFCAKLIRFPARR